MIWIMLGTMSWAHTAALTRLVTAKRVVCSRKSLLWKSAIPATAARLVKTTA